MLSMLPVTLSASKKKVQTYLAEAAFPQYSQEREVAEFDLVQAAGWQLAGLATIRLVDHLLSWA